MGKFITLEGGEGSGKTTLIQRLKEYLEAKDTPVVTTREPGGSLLGESIRHLLLHHDPNVKVGPLAELLLFLAARAQHIEEKIRPALENGNAVICDRFNDSTIAYQGVARKLDAGQVEEFCNRVCGAIVPDVTLLLDIDPRIGLKRAQASRNSMDRMENEALQFHDQVRAAFQALAKKYPQRIVQLDASQTPENVFAQAVEALKSHGI